MDMMQGEKFVQMRRDSYKIANNLWGQEVSDEKIFSNEELQMIHDGEYYDWQDLVFRDGVTQKHNLSVSSGNEKTKFSLSFAYEKDKGYNQNSEAKKFYFTSTVDHKLTSWLDLGAQQLEYRMLSSPYIVSPRSLCSDIVSIKRS